jgi:hypothetical protein
MLLLGASVDSVWAEGSKNLTPANTGTANGVNQFVGYLNHDDGNRSNLFLQAGAPDAERLKIFVKTGEDLYYGFQRIPTNTGGNHNNLIVTLRNAAGTLVRRDTLLRDVASNQQATLLPQNGVIPSYAACAIGPNIGTPATVAGYPALKYTNAGVDQDYYVEISQVNKAGLGADKAKCWYSLWDFTVYNGTVEQRGRLHSQTWSFNTGSAAAQVSTDFQLVALIPSTLGGFYIKQVDLGRTQGFGWLTVANAEGSTNGGTVFARRRSKLNNSAYPQYEIFVDNPDLSLWPTTTVPTVSIVQENVICKGVQPGGRLTLKYQSNAPGFALMMVNLNGVPGYQRNTADVLIEQNILAPGTVVITWDGLDGLGNVVPSNQTIDYRARFAVAPLHIPLFDVENNSFGALRMTDIRPNTGFDWIYWDDIELGASLASVPVQLQLDGTPTGIHVWTNDAGNDRLLNTWSYGYVLTKVTALTYVYDCDKDKDGKADFVDLDDDNDGIPDITEDNGIDYLADADGDNIPNYLDPEFPGWADVNNDGVSDAFDRDFDRIPNAIDLDSDNDGIPDAVETNGGALPLNMTVFGQYPAVYAIGNDSDNDGLVNVVDPTTGGTPFVWLDTDGTGRANAQDLDSDNDGIVDCIEAGGIARVTTGMYANFTDANENGISDDLEVTALPLPNSDASGLQNWLDIDSDNDGITDTYEAQFSGPTFRAPSTVDVNNNGLADNIDPSILGGILLVPVNFDGTDNPDYYDLDSDNDGVPDIIEGDDVNRNGYGDWDANTNFILDDPGFSGDTDADGLLNIFDVVSGFSTAGNSIGTNADRQDTDNAQNEDWRDTDDDGDGILTPIEDNNTDGNFANDFLQSGNPTPDYLFRGDYDEDGVLDGPDLDSDNDGILDANEAGATGFDPSLDADSDGRPNFVDASDATPGFPTWVDSNNDGINDVYDTDLDGVANFRDIDSDGDGILDAIEANGGAINPNLNLLTGTFDLADIDFDGLMDPVDATPAVVGGPSTLPNTNTDGSGPADAFDIDSDNDGIQDIREAISSGLNFTPSGVDFDGDGLDDAFQAGTGTIIIPVDTDGDGIIDMHDLDTDDDGVPDLIEGHDANFNGRPDWDLNNNQLLDEAAGLLDSDGDGLLNIFDVNNGGTTAPLQNTDGDLNRDWRDDNDDNDSKLTINEDANLNGSFFDDFTEGGTPRPDYLYRGDNDNDGIADVSDPDDDNDGVLDVNESNGTGVDPGADADADGIKNYQDPDFLGWVDANADGVNDRFDKDQDGRPDFYDLDSDNDGVTDNREASAGDADGNGIIDGFVDTDADGLADAVDPCVQVVNTGNAASQTNSGTVTNPNNALGAIDLTSASLGNTGVLRLDFTVSSPIGATWTVGISRSAAGAPNATATFAYSADNVTYTNFATTFSSASNARQEIVLTLPAAARYLRVTRTAQTVLVWDARYRFTSCGTINSPIVDQDFDGDGIRNRLDLDSDNDGGTDCMEAGGVDADGDGRYDATIDNDGDGLLEIVDASEGGTPIADSDKDGDTRRNRLDLDSDNDGLTDVVEYGGIDSDGNGRIDGFTDANANGLSEAIDPVAFGTALLKPDSDGDGLRDALDIDSDNDGMTDRLEADASDVSGSGLIDTFTDVNANGLDDFTESNPVSTQDFDSDGLRDGIDTDSDNDGVSDLRENLAPDVNGDGRVDAFADSDNDGLANSFDASTGGTALKFLNSDNDVIPNFRDRDSDQDGLPDAVETGAPDNNKDGIVDGFVDVNLDGMADVVDPKVGGTAPADPDTDGDTRRDRLDLDSDNDGLTDAREAGVTDLNGDGRIDAIEDLDQDGIANGVDPKTGGTPALDPDSDADGYRNRLDLDSDQDGLPDSHEAGVTDANLDGLVDSFSDSNGDGLSNSVDPKTGGTAATDSDFDGDGVRNRVDLDSDNDGLTDALEAGGIDTNGDGRLDVVLDVDRNGYSDLLDPNSGGTVLPRPNTDSNGLPDWLDLDSDNDGVTDAREGGALDADDNGTVDGFTDTDGDGLANSVDPTTGGVPAGDLDTDGDGLRNRLDIDSDSDGIPDSIESDTKDTNFDGRVDNITDVNGNGLADVMETALGGSVQSRSDNDGDGTPDRLDINTDGDAYYDWIEGFDDDEDGESIDDYRRRASTFETANGNIGYYTTVDVNNNGIPDWLDDDDDDGTANYLDPNSTFYHDTDGDGLIDLVDPSSLGATAYGVPLGEPDTDGDVVPNYRDADNQVPLPLDELVFEARKQDPTSARINWQLPPKDDIRSVELERGADALNFSNITQYQVNPGDLSFVYYDSKPLQGWNNYRLRLLYPDGTIRTSWVRQVYFSDSDNPIITVFPNPTADVLNVEGDQVIRLTLTDLTGRVVAVQSSFDGSRQQMDVRNVAAGVYTLVIETATRQITNRVRIDRP